MEIEASGHMLEHGGGAICNLTSSTASRVLRNSVHAGNTKGAIIAYTRAPSIELAHLGIRVNAIAPSWVMVENHVKILPGYTEGGARDSAKDSVPMGRPGVPCDIARPTLFLCSDDAEYIVGQIIIANGGTTARMSLTSDFRKDSTARCGYGCVPGFELWEGVHRDLSGAARKNEPKSWRRTHTVSVSISFLSGTTGN